MDYEFSNKKIAVGFGLKRLNFMDDGLVSILEILVERPDRRWFQHGVFPLVRLAGLDSGQSSGGNRTFRADG
jgi:hypothetical protein